MLFRICLSNIRPSNGLLPNSTPKMPSLRDDTSLPSLYCGAERALPHALTISRGGVGRIGNASLLGWYQADDSGRLLRRLAAGTADIHARNCGIYLVGSGLLRHVALEH